MLTPSYPFLFFCDQVHCSSAGFFTAPWPSMWRRVMVALRSGDVSSKISRVASQLPLM